MCRTQSQLFSKLRAEGLSYRCPASTKMNGEFIWYRIKLIINYTQPILNFIFQILVVVVVVGFLVNDYHDWCGQSSTAYYYHPGFDKLIEQTDHISLLKLLHFFSPFQLINFCLSFQRVSFRVFQSFSAMLVCNNNSYYCWTFLFQSQPTINESIPFFTFIAKTILNGATI